MSLTLSAPASPAPEREAPQESRWLVTGEVALLVALTIITRLPTLDGPTFVDELTHVFAGRSLLQHGTLEVVPGGVAYVRAWPFTYLVAGSYALFGQGLAAARVPALLACAGLVVALFLWVRREGGRLAAWTAALPLCFMPVTIEFSRMARFYTLHALTFWIGAVLTYRLATAARIDRWTLPRAIGAGACFALAQLLQMTTVIGIATVGLWLVLVRGRDALRLIRRQRAAQVVALLVVGVACWTVVAGLRSGELRAYLHLFRYADLWAAGEVGHRWYYVQYLAGEWPTLWTLFPILSVVALWYRPRPASLCVVIFWAALAIHSLAAWKNIRYLFYALPMFFAVVGFAAGAILPPLHRALTAFLRTRFAVLGGDSQKAAALSLLGLAVAGLFAACGNPAVAHAWRDLKRQTGGGAGWAAARPLAPLVDSSAVLVASSPLEALYYFHRIDYGLLATEMKTAREERPEFRTSRVYGRPMVSTAQSLERIMACYPTGLVLVTHDHWQQPWAVTPEAAAFLTQHTDSLPLPRSWRMLAFRWRHPGWTEPEGCPPQEGSGG